MVDRLRRGVLIVACALGAVTACGAKDGPGVATGTTVPATTTTAALAGPGGLPKDCDPAAIEPVVSAKHAGAQLGELVCDGPFAVATVRNGAGIAGDGVMLARFKGGAWTLVASGEIGLDPQRLVPADFGATAFSTWQRKYDLVIHPLPPTTKGAGGGKSNTTQALYYIPGCTPSPNENCTTDQNPGGGNQPVGPEGPTIPHE